MFFVFLTSVTSSRLAEAQQDLQQTRTQLSQEEFISSELTAVQERLHSTAGQVGRLRHHHRSSIF